MSTDTPIAELPEGAAAAIREIRDLAYKATTHTPTTLLDGVTALVVPDAHTLVTADVRAPDTWAGTPQRRRGLATFEMLEPFTRYVNLHADDDATTVWTHHVLGALGATPDPIGSISAILDDHDGRNGSAGWGEHRARIQLVTTPEWQHWLSLDGVLNNQVAFSEHLEDGIAEINEPAAATLLDVVQTIQLTRNSVYAGEAVRTATGGLTFTYKESEDARAGKRGEVEIPEQFKLRIAAFLGGDRVEVKGRLRYRLDDGKLRIGYKLERPQDALHDAVTQLHGALLEQLDEPLQGRVYRGAPVTDSARRDVPQVLEVKSHHRASAF